jgi:hypothetical protein
MQWSKIRTRLLALFASNVKGRVDFHLTKYRKFGDTAHELWVTIDKKRVFSASYCTNMVEEAVLRLNTWGDSAKAERARDILERREVHDPADVVSSIRTFLDLDPQIALTSTDPVLKALAILDRRIGMRTLKGIKIGDDEHSLIRTFYALRFNKL